MADPSSLEALLVASRLEAFAAPLRAQGVHSADDLLLLADEQLGDFLRSEVGMSRFEAPRLVGAVQAARRAGEGRAVAELRAGSAGGRAARYVGAGGDGAAGHASGAWEVVPRYEQPVRALGGVGLGYADGSGGLIYAGGGGGAYASGGGFGGGPWGAGAQLALAHLPPAQQAAIQQAQLAQVQHALVTAAGGGGGGFMPGHPYGPLHAGMGAGGRGGGYGAQALPQPQADAPLPPGALAWRTLVVMVGTNGVLLCAAAPIARPAPRPAAPPPPNAAAGCLTRCPAALFRPLSLR